MGVGILSGIRLYRRDGAVAELANYLRSSFPRALSANQVIETLRLVFSSKVPAFTRMIKIC